MLVYRISSPAYIEDLSGNGAKQYGGRWNEKGVPVVYFAESRAMAVMEVLVHLRPEHVDKAFSLAVFDVPDQKVLKIDVADLPNNWKKAEAKDLLKDIGNKFVEEGKCLIMKVPSVILEEEYNYILNPTHPDSKGIKLIKKRDFIFDKRFKN